MFLVMKRILVNAFEREDEVKYSGYNEWVIINPKNDTMKGFYDIDNGDAYYEEDDYDSPVKI